MNFTLNDIIGRRALIGYAIGGTAFATLYVINHKVFDIIFWETNQSETASL